MNAESTRRVDTKPFHPACAALLWSRKALRPAQDPLPTDRSPRDLPQSNLGIANVPTRRSW